MSRIRIVVNRVLKNIYYTRVTRFVLQDQYVQLTRELKYLDIYLWCLAKWNSSPFGENRNFGFVDESHVESVLEDYIKFKLDLFELLEIIQERKPKIEEDCLDFLDFSFQCDFSIDELLEFMSSISASLQNVLNLNADVTRDAKVKIQYLTDSLDFFKEVLEFTSRWCSSYEDLDDFKIHTQAWTCRIACLSLLYWVQDLKVESIREVILSDLHKIISPSNPGVTRMNLAVLKASKPSEKNHLTASRLVIKFVEFLKDNLQVNPEGDGIQMLFVDLIFLITFFMDPAEKFADGKFISIAASLVDEFASLISPLCSDETTEGITEERNYLLHTFLEKANAAKETVREFCAHLFPDPASFNFPSLNVLGFIDSLLENLKDFSFHFPNHQIMMLREELLSLKESNLKDFSVLELQNKHKDIKDLWTRIVNMAYNAERAVNSFIYIKDNLWHDILCLSDAIREAKLIKGEMKRIRDQHMYDILALNSGTSPNPLIPLQANIPTMDKVFVGFNNEIREIRNQLMSGSEKLHIIAIVGMPGLGKTTLAKKIYTDASLQRHFHKRAWCTVSQQFNRKKMLLQILSDVAASDLSKEEEEEEEEVEERIWRSLKGHKYLIVMDDIWDVSAWDTLKMSFPEDDMGSRIMMTSRIQNVISEAKLGHRLIPLNPLPKEKGWELLEKKLFDQGSCPPNFVEIGRQIATNCKGLPLAIVLIAGLLKEKIESLEWWKQVGGNLDLLIAKEGCRDILELSYEHLSEYLKPCFLYFGLFQEDQEIRVKRLTLLWISEGLVQKHEAKSLDVMAEEYLMDLVARSLVIVNKKSSTGRIKACSLHDLLHDFCIAKGEEEKIIKVIRGGENCAARYADYYRVSFQTSDCWESSLECDPLASSIHSIFYTQDPYSIFAKGLVVSYFRFIQVLQSNLVVYEFQTEKFILLKYLSINFGYLIPPSIKRLENLETLRNDSNGYPADLPLTLWEMQKLRNVCGNLRLPTDFCDHDISPLENVQTFSLEIPFENPEMFFRTIPKVRKLKCILSFHPPQPYKIVRLDFLSRLESLTMRNETPCSSALCFPPTLKKLQLRNFQSTWSEISHIAKLPNLEVLKLCSDFDKGIWNVGDEEFLKLKCLVLRNLNLEQLNASDESFPYLERLMVERCGRLDKIPTRFGSISTLKMIWVKDCRYTLEESVWQIQEEQVDLGNKDLEVFIFRAFHRIRSHQMELEELEEENLLSKWI